MQYGWELIRQNRYGWSTVSRSFDKDAYTQYQQWIRINKPTQGGTFELRAVTDQTPYLVDQPYSALVERDREEEAMPDRETTIKNDAFALGNAIAMVLANPSNPDRGAVFTIARRFAKFSDYSDADSALTYIEGFVSGFQQGSGTKQQSIESGD